MDPCGDGSDLNFSSVPVRHTVHDVLTMLQARYFHKDLQPFETSELSLNRSELRLGLGRSEIAPYLGNNLYREALGALFHHETKYESYRMDFALRLVRDCSPFRNVKTTPDELRELFSLIYFLSDELLYRGKDDQRVFDVAGSYLFRLLQQPTLALAIEMREIVDRTIVQYSLPPEAAPGLVRERAEAWLITDIYLAGKAPRNSPYIRLSSEKPFIISSSNPLTSVPIPPQPDEDQIEDGMPRSYWERLAKVLVPMDKAKRPPRK